MQERLPESARLASEEFLAFCAERPDGERWELIAMNFGAALDAAKIELNAPYGHRCVTVSAKAVQWRVTRRLCAEVSIDHDGHANPTDSYGDRAPQGAHNRPSGNLS